MSDRDDQGAPPPPPPADGPARPPLPPSGLAAPQSPAVVRAASLDSDPLKYSFKNFMWKTWRTLGFPDPTPLHYDVADWIDLGPDKSITMGFRGAAKSYIAVTKCLHVLYIDPEDEMVLTVSATSKFAGNNAWFAYSMVNGFDWLSHMKPRSNQRQSALAFDVAAAKPKKSESFCSESLFGQITGRRATFILPDDVEVPSTSDTEQARATLASRFGELGGAILTNKADGTVGRIKVLGTAQTENTLYVDLATNKGYGMRMFPVLYPAPEELVKYGSWLAPRITQELEVNPSLAGTSTEPTRFTEADIYKRRLDWGSVEFDRQFKLFLDAGQSNQKRFLMRDLMVMSIPKPTPRTPLALPAEMHWSPTPDRAIPGIEVDALNGDSKVYAPIIPTDRDNPWAAPEGCIMMIDPSGEGTDETAWWVLAQRLGRVFLCHRGSRLEGFSADTIEAIAKDAKEWGVQLIKIEKNFGGGMFAELLRPALMKITHPCSIEEEFAKGQKEARIVDSLEALVTSHRIVVSEEVLKADYVVPYSSVEDAKRRFYRFTYQFTRITKRKGCLAHDDRVDALESGVMHFLGVLRRELEAAASEAKGDYLMAQAQKIIDSRIKQGLPLIGQGSQGGNGVSRLGHLLKDYGMRQSPAFRGRS